MRAAHRDSALGNTSLLPRSTTGLRPHVKQGEQVSGRVGNQPQEARRWHGQDANLPACYHPAFYQFMLLHKRFFLLSLLLIACALCSPQIFCWSGVMCLARPSSDKGLVLFNAAAIQTVNDNYKRGLSGDDFIALPSCIAILAFKVFVTESLPLSDCAVQ